jgi:hypothetical protein
MTEVNTNHTPGPLENNLIRDINANNDQSYDSLNHIIDDIYAIGKAYPDSTDSAAVLADASKRADITKLGFPPNSIITGVEYGPILTGTAPDGHPLKLFNNNIGNWSLGDPH